MTLCNMLTKRVSSLSNQISFNDIQYAAMSIYDTMFNSLLVIISLNFNNY